MAGRALFPSGAKVQGLLDAAPGAMVGFGVDGCVTLVNVQAERLFGYDRNELIGQSLEIIIPAWGTFGDGRYSLDYGLTRVGRHKNGAEFSADLSLRSLPTGEGWLTVLAVRDMSGDPSSAAGAELEERFQTVFDAAPNAMILVDGSDSRIIRANGAFASIVGHEPDALVGLGLADLTHPADMAKSLDKIEELHSGKVDSLSFEKRYLRSDGSHVWASVRVGIVRDDDGLPLYRICAVEDITERRALQRQITHSATHDALTDLPNRALFMDRLRMALQRIQRKPGHVMVVFLDLDHFTLVNDNMGHDAGDQVLRTMAQRLHKVMRPGDTVARFGGDEFTLVCEEVADQDEAQVLVNRIVAAVQAPLQIDGSEFFVTASAGIALGRGPGDVATALVRSADKAMVRAKEVGPSSTEFYDWRQDNRSAGQLRMSCELRRAIERDELELHYQPVVDLASMQPIATEALVRWCHPTRGLLLPGEFIELAEDTGIIVSLGRWVLMKACQQTAQWQELQRDQGRAGAVPRIAVNVSPRQLAEVDFVSEVVEIIEDAGIDPDVVWLEITEGMFLANPARATRTLRALRDQGVHISIDDFGTGYASLGYLGQLPVEALKIDRGFITGLGRDPANTAIVRTVLALAQSLGLTCVAEGVETDDQIEKLRDLGCAFAQGFAFGRPLPAEQLDGLAHGGLSAWGARPTPPVSRPSLMVVGDPPDSQRRRA